MSNLDELHTLVPKKRTNSTEDLLTFHLDRAHKKQLDKLVEKLECTRTSLIRVAVQMFLEKYQEGAK